VAKSLYEPPEVVRGEESHWIQTAEAFMVGCMADAYSRGEANLGAVYLWLTNPSTSQADKLKAMLRQS